MIVELSKLPKPSENIIRYVKFFSQHNSPGNASKEWFTNTQKTEINCASGKFFNDKLIETLGRKEYQQYFDIEINPGIGILRNTSIEAGPAFVPPHVDKLRPIALLFAVNTGGKNCTTSFYKTNSLFTPDETIMINYGELECSSCTKTLPNTWYALNVQSFHSVENIDTERLLFSITMNLTYDNFIKKYSNLI